MESRRVGNSGLKVSTIGVGTWLHFASIEDYRPLIAKALDEGVFHFDTADLYGSVPGWSEELLGKTLKGFRRSAYVLSSKVCTKVGNMPNDKGLSRKHIMESCERSIRRLGTEYLDIYYCHRFDEETDLCETLDTFATLKNQGKILYIGISMWKADQIREFCRLARDFKVQVIANQLLYNVLQRPSPDVLAACQECGVGLFAYSPLAQGLLSGKYLQGIPESSRGATPHRNKWLLQLLEDKQLQTGMQQIENICRESGISMAEASYGWLLARKNLAGTIGGFRTKEQFEEILRFQFKIPQNVLGAIDNVVYQTK